MSDSFRIQLTDEQRALILEQFGHDVPELTLTVEDFNSTRVDDDMQMRVLKIDNIATVSRSGGGPGNTMN